jgi:Fur family ferric uptake transcriptional regulator
MEQASLVELFAHYLKSRGMNVTQVRRQITETLFAERAHVTAADLWVKLRAAKISSSTIYRTLELLVQGGLVRKLDLGKTHAHYEPVLGRPRHEHLICSQCSKIIEFQLHQLDEKLFEAAERHGFAAQYHDLKVFGICPDCQKKSPTHS